jgi:hypothetical protein
MFRRKCSTIGYNVRKFLVKIMDVFTLNKYFFVFSPYKAKITYYCLNNTVPMLEQVIQNRYVFWQREFGEKKSAYTPRVAQTIRRKGYEFENNNKYAEGLGG